MLMFLRSEIAKGGLQFIMATHSPFLINAADEKELFVLTPKPAWPDDLNHLIQLTNEYDKPLKI